MPARVDLTGKKFGEWEVIRYLGNRKYECKCSCGKICSVGTFKLTNGDSKSCGHGRNQFVDLTGQVFGEWTVVDYAGNHIWNCKCSCGKMGKVASKALRDGKSRSCGHSTTAFKDIKGQTFGEWTALEYVGLTIWKCRCSCGEIGNVKLYDLLNGRSKSCGHDSTRFIDLTGKVFGYLTVEEYLGDKWWKCRCICGNEYIVKSQRIRTGVSTSCGCKSAEKTMQTNMIKYGVPHSSQRNRTPEQVEITSSPDKLLNAIITNFKDKPTPRDVAKLIGVTPHRAMVIVRSLGLDNFIELDKATSQYEDELNELFPCQHRSDRTLLHNLELDLYYPEKSIAIEFNGNYWHSEIYKEHTYHQKKSLLAKKEGVHIIHIFEYEWKDSDTKEKLIKMIRRRLGSNARVIYAKQCIVKDIDNYMSAEFCNRVHIQGGTNSTISLGLFYMNELLGVMTFGKPRFNWEYEYELIRLAWKDDVQVVGGSEKLFSYFKQKYCPTSIISYCDFSKFEGNVYKKLGFKEDELTSPNYKWVIPEESKVLSRYQTMKDKLLQLGLGTKDESEADIMHRQGYVRVYDCGNFRFVWNNPNTH